MENVKLILTTREPLLVFLVGVVMFLFGATGVLPLYYTTIPIIDNGWRVSVALFGIILVAFSIFLMLRRKFLTSKIKELAGAWEVKSISNAIDKRRASSTATIVLDDGEIRIVGGTFFNIKDDGTTGDAIGDWDVEMVMSDGQKIRFCYCLTDSLAAHSTCRGFAEMTLQPSTIPPTFIGTWQVIGKEIHNGRMTMTKKSS